MSHLPAGVVNRPFVTTHPRVLRRVLGLILLCLFVVSPLLVYLTCQIDGIKTRRECADIERRIVEQRDVRRLLLAEQARLLAPERLRVEAERLGLVPPPLTQRPGAPFRPDPVPPAAEPAPDQDTATTAAPAAPAALPAAFPARRPR